MNKEFENKVRDVLNQDCRVPESVESKAYAAFEQIREQAEQVTGIKRRRLSKLQRFSIVALLLISIAGIMGAINPALANNVLFTSVFKLFVLENYGEQAANFEKLSQGVKQSVTSNGVKITLNEIALDENTVAISFVIEGKNLKKEPVLMGHIDINGKPVTTTNMKYIEVLDNSIAGMVFGTVDQDIPDQINMEWNVVWVDNIKGPWDFKFSISKSNTAKYTKVIRPEIQIDLGYCTLRADKIVLGPLDNTIDLSGKYNTSYQTNGQLPYRDFLLVDDTGKALVNVFRGASSNKGEFSIKLSFMGDVTNLKSITVIPITNKQLYSPVITKSELVFTQDFIDFTAFKGAPPLKVNNQTSLTLTRVEANEDSTDLYFTIDGYYHYYMLNTIDLVDESGKVLGKPEGIPFPVVSNSNRNEVLFKYPPVDKSKKYKIGVPKMENLTLDEKGKMIIPISD